MILLDYILYMLIYVVHTGTGYFMLFLWNGVCGRNAIALKQFYTLLRHFIKPPSWAVVAGSEKEDSEVVAQQPEETTAGDKLWYWDVLGCIGRC